jgi:hypothetical protein
MTAHASQLPVVCRQLKVLDDAIASQRRIIANLEACKLDTSPARECLAQLLEQLDRVLAGGEIDPYETANGKLAYAE